tara:strand:+ start:341 stop:658 length:318 start_codon:yes stop_codon:yes gene_type:complete
MKNINQLIFIYLTFLFLSGCAAVQEGFSSNKKKDGSDAFLVEKKAPLVMPPNYEELPFPKQNNQVIGENSGNIKKLISNDNENNVSVSSENDVSLEENILEKIKN